MAKSKTINVKYNGNGSFSNGDWIIKSGECLLIPEDDYKFLVDTGQDSELEVCKDYLKIYHLKAKCIALNAKSCLMH